MSDTKCPHCGYSVAPGQSVCSQCEKPLPWAKSEAAAASALATESASPVVNRYRDAYRVGAALVGLGDAIKIIGTILGGIILLGSLSSANSQFAGGGLAFAGAFAAAVVGGIFWVCGVIVAAQGQILQATPDTAVGSSPFLTHPQRADAMGLPQSVADRARAS